ncbi:MAG: LemA family protein [Desulfamplus sp.]|nr:LemA family protein [Desulfamplus sp.]
MATRTVTRIIKNAYGRRYNLDSYELATQPYDFSIRESFSRLEPLFDFLRNRWIHIIGVVLTIILMIGTIYYYNTIMICLQNVDTGNSKVSALMQRRNDISINLSKAVLDYSKYERNVFTGIVALRTLVSGDAQKEQALRKLMESSDISKTSSAESGTHVATATTSTSAGQTDNSGNTEKSLDKPVATNGSAVKPVQSGSETSAINPLVGTDNTLNSLSRALNPLGKLMAVAEQYPDLKLSTTFNSLMLALIEVEKDLAAERLKYNDQVNKYTTITAMFPGNFFAWLFNFPERSYFDSTEDAKSLVPIGY